MRRTDGAEVEYSDGEGTRGYGRLSGDHVGRESERVSEPPSPRLTVGAVPIRSRDRLRYMVEKAAEVGLNRLLWLESRRAQMSPPPAERTAGWAIAALEQSRSAWLMEVVGPTKPLEMKGHVWVADPRGEPMDEVTDEVALLIGPEGGWAPEEIEGLPRVTLGPSVLRAETAVVVAAVLLAQKSGRLGGRRTR